MHHPPVSLHHTHIHIHTHTKVKQNFSNWNLDFLLLVIHSSLDLTVLSLIKYCQIVAYTYWHFLIIFKAGSVTSVITKQVFTEREQNVFQDEIINFSHQRWLGTKCRLPIDSPGGKSKYTLCERLVLPLRKLIINSILLKNTSKSYWQNVYINEHC